LLYFTCQIKKKRMAHQIRLLTGTPTPSATLVLPRQRSGHYRTRNQRENTVVPRLPLQKRVQLNIRMVVEVPITDPSQPRQRGAGRRLRCRTWRPPERWRRLGHSPWLSTKGRRGGSRCRRRPHEWRCGRAPRNGERTLASVRSGGEKEAARYTIMYICSIGDRSHIGDRCIREIGVYLQIAISSRIGWSTRSIG